MGEPCEDQTRNGNGDGNSKPTPGKDDQQATQGKCKNSSINVGIEKSLRCEGLKPRVGGEESGERHRALRRSSFSFSFLVFRGCVQINMRVAESEKKGVLLIHASQQLLLLIVYLRLIIKIMISPNWFPTQSRLTATSTSLQSQSTPDADL